MATIELEGETLGQKHRSFNSFVKIAAADDKFELSAINYGESDIQNLIRIDVACIRRDAYYILQVLEGDDMLYIFRALRGSVWLVNDERYSYIINPKYVDKKLFPKMTPKEKKKMLVFIRNNLNDTARSEEFFNYYKDNITLAQHWLHHCSVDFVLDVLDKHADNISLNVMKHLCRKSSAILKRYLMSHCRDSRLLHRYLLQANSEEVSDMLDLICLANQRIPTFGKKFTRSLMKRYQNIFIDDFDKYHYYIHIPTFVKYLKKEDIEKILLDNIKKYSMKPFFRYDNLKHFLRYMPETQRLRFIKTIRSENEDSLTELKGALGWDLYELMPFDNAFPELKIIMAEKPSNIKQNLILSVVLRSARGNPQNIKTLLEYYRMHHLNDSFEDKVYFLNKLLSPSSIHKFDKCIWSILDEIFATLDFYTMDGDVPKCLEAMIVHKLLENEQIPEAFGNKVNFKSFIDYRNQLDANEERKVVDYVYDSCFTKLCKTDVDDVEEMSTIVDLVRSALSFLSDWNKSLVDYPAVKDVIREIIKIKIERSWGIDLHLLYETNKLFKAHLIEESLVLCPSDKTCVNVLKHKPEILWQHRDELVATLTLKRTLEKLRIFWPKSAVQQWIDLYLEQLQLDTGHIMEKLVEGLCILLPREEAMSLLIRKYAPTQSEDTELKEMSGLELSLGQSIAKCLHLIRPSVDEKVLLMYAKKEYLPYILPSFDIILRRRTSNLTEFWNTILLLLDNNAFYRYAARVSYSLMEKDALKSVKSINTKLVIRLKVLLCGEKNSAFALDLWNLFSKILDDLPYRDINRMSQQVSYSALNKAVLTKFFRKMYLLLSDTKFSKDAPERFITSYSIMKVFNDLELDFVEDVVLQVISQQIFDGNFYESPDILCMYLLNCNNEKMQMERYEKNFVPIMKHYFDCWDCFDDSSSYRFSIRKHRFYDTLNNIAGTLFESIIKLKFIVPVQLFTHIRDKLEEALNFEEDCHLIMTWNLYVIFVTLLNDHLKKDDELVEDADSKWNRICLSLANDFGQAATDYLMPFLLECSSFHVLVSRVCLKAFSCLHLENNFKLNFIKYLLNNFNHTIAFIVAVDVLRNLYRYNSNEKPLIYKDLVEIIRSNSSMEVKYYYNHYEEILLGGLK